MKNWIKIALMVLAMGFCIILFVFSAGALLESAAQEVKSNGGLKTVVEEIWNGERSDK